MHGLLLVADLVVLTVAAWPLARLLATRPFRRKLRSFPRIGLALALACGGAGLLVTAAAVYSPTALTGCAVLAGGIVAAAAWRARPSFGRARRLPQGSLGLLPVGPLIDDRFFLRQAERHGPVFKTSQFLRPMVCVLGLERCVELLRRYDDVLDPPALPFDHFVPGGFVRSMPAERHDRYLVVLRMLASKDVLSSNEPFMAEAARNALHGLATSDAHTRGVAPRPALRAMLFTMLMRVLFGITPDASDFPQLLFLYDVIDVRRPSGALRRRALPALERIMAIVRRALARAPRGDRPVSLLAAIAAAHPGAAEDPVVLANLVYVVQNARDDTAGLLDWALKLLGDHPAWAIALRDAESSGGTGADDLASRIVLETLRLEQSEFLFRTVRAPIEVDGFVVPAGWLLRLCIRESHRDPTVFERPEAFDPDRFLRRSYTRHQYSPFGALTSRHACLGEQLTKTVARIVLVELARGFEWRVVSDGPREFDGWHWTPSSRFRIAVARRSRYGW